jgi:ComF family protein
MKFDLFDFFASLFFPRLCLACGRSLRAGALCSSCRATIAVSRTLFCGECGIPLHPVRGNCHPLFPYVLGSAGSYQNRALKELVHALKFRGIAAAAEPLATALVEYATSIDLPLAGFTVMPIPLSRERLRSRGFNQSERISKIFSERLGLPMDTRSLARVRHAKPQSETKDLVERKENIRGCFAVTERDAVCGKNIVLIDDVTTSGATFLEAARILKEAGAAKIIALAAARA